MERGIFHQRLKNGVLLFDGGIGTQLQERGLGIGVAPESWNIEHPDWVREIHRSYVDAGAEALTTNSFGGSRFKLEKGGFGDRVVEINSAAASLAREAAGTGTWVAGSVGPTGEFLEPLGTVHPDQMKEAFRIQVKALIDGGADLIIIETMTALDEIVLAIQAARDVGDFPIIASMTFDPTKQGYRTMMGVDIPTAVRTLQEEGADAVGSNCGNGIDDFIHIVGEIRAVTDRFIVAEANAGIPELQDGKTVYRETPEMMSSKLPKLLDAGATIVGGCCGTTPEHIRQFRDVIDRHGI